MKTINLPSGTTVVVYASIRELPIELSKKMQAYLLQDAGIGSTVQDIDDRLARLTTFVAADRKGDALEELKNLRFALFSSVSGIRFDALALGCLLYSVDGKEITDRSAEGLATVLEKLSKAGLSEELLQETLADVKKNLLKNELFISLSSSPRT